MIETVVKIDKIKLTPNRTKKSYLTKDEYDTLKMSLRVVGLWHGIFLNQDFEILDGEMRFQIYQELNKEFPDAFIDIKAFVLSEGEEVKHLMTILNNNPNDYELDSALDRLNILDKAPNREDLSKRLVTAGFIREGVDLETIRDYKQGKISHDVLYRMIACEENDDEVKEFDIKDWL